MSNAEEATIVLVEDDPGHAYLIQRNLRRLRVKNKIVLLENGQKAVDYLVSEVAKPDASPLLMLLDLNLPVLDGYQVLQWIKEDERTRRIPVIVLTTTDNKQEVLRCYKLGCSVYITKPIDYTDFVGMLERIRELLTVLTVPTNVA